jgi:galactosylceramidase
LNENSGHFILLNTKGDKIKAIINEQVVAYITDSTYTHGMVGLGSSFHPVDFDNIEVK